MNRGILQLRWHPLDVLDVQLTASGGADLYQDPTFKVWLPQFQVRPKVTWRPLRSLSLALGGEYMGQYLNGETYQTAPDGTSTTTALSHLNQRPIAVFTELNWRPWGVLEIVPSFRVEHYVHPATTVVDPRGMVRYEAVRDRPGAKSLVLKTGVGLYHQPPSLVQMAAGIGNGALTPQQALHVMAGIEYMPTPTLRIDLIGFYVSLTNAIVATTAVAPNADGIPTPTNFDNSGLGQSFGGSIFIQQQLWRHFEGWLSYTFARAELTTVAGQHPISAFDQTHVLALTLAYTLPYDIKLSLRFQLASGNPTTAAVSSIFNSTSNQYIAVNGPDLGDRVAPFEQLDLRIDKTWSFASFGLTAYLDVRNVYNYANVADAYVYNFDYTQKTARVGMPILPIVGLRLDF
jgi:outer membrane receptor for ferrienterochelin and colicin